MAEKDSHYNNVNNPSATGSMNTNDSYISDECTPKKTEDGSGYSYPLFPGIPPLDSQPIFPIVPSRPVPEAIQPPPETTITLPTLPAAPMPSFGLLRFLNASTNTFGVDIAVDGNPYVLNSNFSNISNYERIPDGFHTITIHRSNSNKTILLQENLPFTADQKATVVLVDSPMGDLELVRVMDVSCSNLPQTTSCYRFANMSYANTSYNLLLDNGETIFRNISYQLVSPYKQALAATYRFAVTNANRQITVRELPVIIIGASGTTAGSSDILLTFQAVIAAGRNYTTYLIGNNWSEYSLRAITVED